MINFIWLLFAHFIGDIALQGQWQADNKGTHWFVMLCHCMIYTALICIALEYIGMLELWKVFFILVGHILIDTWKCTYETKPENMWTLYVDQTIHLIQLVIVFVI